MSSENVKARVIATVTGREYVPTTTVELQPGQEVVDRPTGTPSDPLGPDPTGENLMRVLDLPHVTQEWDADNNPVCVDDCPKCAEELAPSPALLEAAAEYKERFVKQEPVVVEHKQVHIVAREGEYPPSNYFLTEQDVRDVYEAEQAGMSLGMYHFFRKQLAAVNCRCEVTYQKSVEEAVKEATKGMLREIESMIARHTRQASADGSISMQLVVIQQQ